MGEVIVIGGGAAGMMAALTAAEAGARVRLIEKNEKLGKKLFITGKGRCNVTNAGDADVFFENVRRNGKFLYSAFYGYDNYAMMDFLEKAGCPLKTERGDRVFPVSDHSSDIIAAFQRELKKKGVDVLLNTEVKELIWKEDTEDPGLDKAACKAEEGHAVSQEGGSGKEGKKEGSPAKDTAIIGIRLKNGRILSADRCIVCTGGLSYPSTGSTGDGYRFARETGHEVEECRPSLVPFTVKEKWCGQLTGLSLRNVSVRLRCGEREIYQGFGEMLFTHFGVSGPLILSASSYYGDGKKGSKNASGEIMLYIDLKPALDPEQLDRRILRDFEENKNKLFKNALGKLFPAKLIPVMVELSGIHPEKAVNEITREERRNLVSLTKNLPLTVTGLGGYEEAVITRGGVSVKDVNPSTMESKRVRGLYFAGEVLDLDALTGGFNLQIAWSTGHLAGENVAT